MVYKAEDLPILVASEGDLKGKRWVLDTDEFVIGRDPTCDLCVPDRQISRYHARIRRVEAGYSIEDLGSKNGTYLNGINLKKFKIIQDGDEIQVASR